MDVDFLKVGTKLEITSVPGDDEEFHDEGISYTSMIEDTFPNGDLEIDMPTYQRKLVLLHNGMRYQVCFFQGKVTYMAICEVVDRYKTGNRYFLRVAMKTQPVKFQRREYFRCECLIDFMYTELPNKEYDNEALTKLRMELQGARLGNLVKSGVILDISGGGIRFASKEKTIPGGYIRILFDIPVYEDGYQSFDLIGKVISSDPIEDTRMKYVNRVMFMCIENSEREEIIRFIFEQERKTRKLSRG